MHRDWLNRGWFWSTAIFATVAVQFVAMAVDPDKEPPLPPGQELREFRAASVKGELLVRYKDSVTACVHCLLRSKRPFKSATTDQSDSLDRLHQKYQVRAGHPIFRTDLEETHLKGKLAQLPLVVMKQHYEKRLNAIKAKFPHRTKRAPPETAIPGLYHLYILEVPDETNLEQAAFDFSQDPHIEYAQPNYLVEAAFLPNDPYYSSSGSWGQAYEDLWGLKKIQAGTAWDLSQGNGIVVAVVDTGIDYNHPDIAVNIWTNPGEIAGNGLDDDGNSFIDDTRGYDFTTCASLIGSFCVTPKAPDNNPIDGHGHGTHVAGTIAAVGNTEGIIGVAPQAKVMAVKGLNDQGQGTSSNLAAALRYAVDNGADVINNSWICPVLAEDAALLTSPCPSNPTLEDTVTYAYGLGGVVVFAAGNNSDDVTFYSPQNLTTPKPIVVAATAHDDLPTDFTNKGLLLDLAAPGGGTNVSPPSTEPARNILSLKAATCHPNMCGSSNEFIVGTNYLRQKGTSMAAPHVSGVAALVLAKRPFLTNEEVRQLLRASADDVHSPDADYETSFGRLNAKKALDVSAVPQVKIVSPIFGQSFTQAAGSISIVGTAAGSAFVQYELASGQGLFPTSWTTIAGPIFTQVINGTLGSWSIGSLATGTYTLRLSVMTSDGFQFQDRIAVEISQDTRLKQITSSSASQYFPDVNGNRIAWHDSRNGNWDVFFCEYDKATGTCLNQPLATAKGEESYPAVSGQYIVWQRYSQANWDVELYDFSTSTTTAITTDRTDQGYPAISGNRIVWHDSRNGHWDIYLRDLATGLESRITTSSAQQTYPQISGNLIAWQDDRNGNFDIYLYDLALSAERRLTNHPASQQIPAVSGNFIVWLDFRNGNWDIYLCDYTKYDAINQVCPAQPITTNPAHQVYPAISDNRIVWHDFRNGNADIYSCEYDSTTGSCLERSITTHPAPQYFPRVFGNLVVWHDGRNNNYDIYLYEVPLPPVISPIGDKTVSEGQQLTFLISATEPEAQLLTLTEIGLPPGATLTTLTALPGQIEKQLTWTPNFTQAGNYPVTFMVSDAERSDSETITITVMNVNRAPVVNAGADQTVTYSGGTRRISLDGTGSFDPDVEDSLTYSWSQTAGPSVPLVGAATATPYFDITSLSSDTTYSFFLTVSDGALSASDTVNIVVDVQTGGGGGFGGGGKVICTELFRQGHLPKEWFVADLAYAQAHIDSQTMKVYHLWAKPLVRMMERSKLVTNVVRPFANAWAQHMAYELGASPMDSPVGRFLQRVGLPLHQALARIIFGSVSTPWQVTLDMIPSER